MKQILLSSGDWAKVDDQDYDMLMEYKWYNCKGYAYTHKSRIPMHRMIMKAKSGELVDHADRNKLNNQRNNLSLATYKINTHNSTKRKNTLNTYKGTYCVKGKDAWHSRCRINGDHFLGYYKSEIAAAYAWNKKAQELSSYVLLNTFDLTIEELEQKLVDDLLSINPAAYQSTHPGLFWHKKSQKWEVKLRMNKAYKYIGIFKAEDEALQALNTAREKYLS